MPKFPTIKPTAIGRQLGKTDLGTYVNIWQTPQGNGAVAHIPSMANLIFHNKRVHVTNLKRLDANTYEEITERVWEIPFTVDTLIPLVEITQRLDSALDKLGLYTNWKINYNDYNITATEQIREKLK